MEVPEQFQALCERMRQELGAERIYIVDIDQEATGGVAATLVFGLRNTATPPLAARLHIAQVLQQTLSQPVGVEVFSSAEEEVEYLFDHYLRPYIATHGGVVTVERIDESAKRLWIHMDGGCSGCPASLATLKHGIERTLKKHLPWVDKVEAVNEAVEPDFNIHLDFSPFVAASATTEEQR
ncbi:MAG: NifU family protein [Chloroflexi bacterium]|nr:NifU family protein [Chloroflexota bacterium]